MLLRPIVCDINEQAYKNIVQLGGSLTEKKIKFAIIIYSGLKFAISFKYTVTYKPHLKLIRTKLSVNLIKVNAG